MEKIRDRARGRWHGIISALGVPAYALTGKHRPCPLPGCGGKDRFRFDDKDGNGTFFCSGCGAGDGVQFVMKLKGLSFKDAAADIESVIGAAPVVAKTKEMRPEEREAALARLWENASKITRGDPVDRYLRGRGIGLDFYPPTLRFAPSVAYRDEEGRREKHPAMLAALIDVSGAAVNIHRTYLTPDGRKAAVDEVRKMMPGGIPAGAAIRLAPHGSKLGIAEGIETALAATALFGVPCWSAINSSGLVKWLAPVGVTEVIIYGDNDPKFGGQSAAYALAHRLACAGLGASVQIPPTVGEDWNDVLTNARRAA
jgi:putative DNA primase/helicase